ncbi:MAG: PA14 domain-containing protein [Chloroflexota bacterium]|nr:PA14 domain-containing protein [Chloroflexota bacterium]
MKQIGHVIRRPLSTLVFFEDSNTVYRLADDDVKIVEAKTGRLIEFFAEDELRATLQRFHIAPEELSDEDRAEIAGRYPESSQDLVDAALAVQASESLKPLPEPPVEEETVVLAAADGGAPVDPGEPEKIAADDGKSNRGWLTVLLLALAALAAVAAIFFLVNMLGGDSTEPGGGITPVVATPTIEQATPTPLPTPEPGIPTVTAINNTYIYGGPGTDYEISGVLPAGQSAEVTGTSADGRWWVIKLPSAESGQGWVQASDVQASGTGGAPVVPLPPLPTPTATPPIVISDWKGEYYDNRGLRGEPVIVRNDTEIDFNWGTSSPAPGMPSENWSARWSIERDVPAGTYRFSVWVDDGVRIWVDDVMIIDGWQEGSARNYTQDVVITRGIHSVVVEYFQGAGSASLRLDVGYVDEYPDWKGEYFDNPNVAGYPILIRNDREIDFNWGTGSPAPGIPSDNYSVRWTQIQGMEQGDFSFSVKVSGGVRLWLDGRLLIDDWVSQPSRVLQASSGVIAQGDHDFRVEYFKSTGVGQITVQWFKQQPVAPPTAVIAGPSQAMAGQEVIFSGSQSTAAPGHTITTYEWAFGDGTGGTGVQIAKTYPSSGTYDVRLTVTDDQGLTGTSSHRIQIDAQPSQPPTAVINAVTQGVVGETILFNGSASTGPNPIVTYQWSFGDGSGDGSAVAEHVYDRAGVFSVTLRVVDSAGQEDSAVSQIEIRAGDTPTQVPTATPVATPTPEPTPIVGTSWSLTYLTSGPGSLVSILPNTELTALFGLDFSLSGSGGCNQYNTTYVAQGTSIRIDPVSATNLICDIPGGIMEQEASYFGFLTQASSYRMSADRLELLNDQGEVLLQFVPLAGPY